MADYPPPRMRREGAAIVTATGEVVPAAGIPTTHTYWVHNTTAANSRTSSSTPKLLGPAILRKWVVRANNAVNPPTMFFEVGVATAPVSEVNVGLSTFRPYRSIHEKMEPSSASVDTTLTGFPSSSLIGSTDHAELSVDHIILEPEFYLVLSNLNASAGVLDWVGYFTVVEGVSRQALVNFL